MLCNLILVGCRCCGRRGSRHCHSPSEGVRSCSEGGRGSHSRQGEGELGCSHCSDSHSSWGSCLEGGRGERGGLWPHVWQQRRPLMLQLQMRWLWRPFGGRRRSARLLRGRRQLLPWLQSTGKPAPSCCRPTWGWRWMFRRRPRWRRRSRPSWVRTRSLRWAGSARSRCCAWLSKEERSWSCCHVKTSTSTTGPPLGEPADGTVLAGLEHALQHRGLFACLGINSPE